MGLNPVIPAGAVLVQLKTAPIVDDLNCTGKVGAPEQTTVSGAEN